MRIPPASAVAPAALVATVFLPAVELLRAASPLLDRTAGGAGVLGAAGVALAMFAAPALVGPAMAAMGAARATVGAVALLLVLRLVAQGQAPPTLAVVGAGAAAGVAALVLVVRQAPSGGTAATGLLLGGAADLAVRAGYGSWDPVFRPGVGPVLLSVAVAAAAVTALVAARPGLAPPPAGRVGVVGIYLALYLLGYGSAPIVAAHTGVSLPVAALLLIVTAVVALEWVRRAPLPARTRARSAPDRTVAGYGGSVAGLLPPLALVAGIAGAYWLTGPVVLAAVPVAGVAAAVLCARALTPPAAPARHPAVGYAAAGLAAGLGYLLPVMVYQLHYDLEFPFDNRLALVAAAAVLGVAGLRPRPADTVRERGITARMWTRPAGVSVAAALALLVPLGVAATRPAVPPPEQTGATVRLLSWNVMYGRHHTRGDITLGGIADVIEAVDPDVVLLQEVSRGWPIGGGADMAEWLSRRVAMRYEWAPAADGQFGNALLTRLPLSDVETGRLPYGQGPMERSYVAATLRLAGGRELRVMNAHLQHRKENTPTRLAQSEELLAAWGGARHTVIAGDFNFWPSWREAEFWTTAGFVSAQDVTGHGAEFTGPSDDPDNRVDWVFGTPDLSFSDFAVRSDVVNSDHFPLVVTVHLA